MKLSTRQVKNIEDALSVVTDRGLDDTYAQQVLCLMATEVSFLNYENPLFPITRGLGDGMPPGALAPATKNSVGVAQQQVHNPQWWGPVGLNANDQAIYFMNVKNAVGLFLDRLVKVPRTSEPWKEIQAVQGSQFKDASNYQNSWELAGQVLAQFKTPSTDWSTMATQAEFVQALQQVVGNKLDALSTKVDNSEAFGDSDSYRQDIANKVADTLTGTGDKAVAFRAAVAADIWAKKFTSFDGQDYPASQFLESINEHTAPVPAPVVDPPVVTPGPVNPVSGTPLT